MSPTTLDTATAIFVSLSVKKKKKKKKLLNMARSSKAEEERKRSMDENISQLSIDYTTDNVSGDITHSKLG